MGHQVVVDMDSVRPQETEEEFENGVYGSELEVDDVDDGDVVEEQAEASVARMRRGRCGHQTRGSSSTCCTHGSLLKRRSSSTT